MRKLLDGKLIVEDQISGWSLSGEMVEKIDEKAQAEYRRIPIENIRKMKTKTAYWVAETYDCKHLILSGLLFTNGDDACKIAIMQEFPEVEKALQEEFGEKWAQHYLKFGH